MQVFLNFQELCSNAIRDVTSEGYGISCPHYPLMS